MVAAAVGGETRVLSQSRGVAMEEGERDGAMTMEIRVHNVTTSVNCLIVVSNVERSHDVRRFC